MNTRKCEVCNTRPVDSDTQGESFSTMCTSCYDFAGWENTHTDENHSESNVDPDCPVCQGNEKPMDNQTALRPKGRCNCSSDCIGTTGKVFSQGHDARMVTRLIDSVMAQQLTASEAEKELLQRGGSGLLLSKFSAALDRASRRNLDRVIRKLAKSNGETAPKAPKAKTAKTTKAEKQATITVDGFELFERHRASEPDVHAKIGRWFYDGHITEHRMVGGEKDDTMMVFHYTAKSGEKVVTTKFLTVSNDN